MTLFENHGGLHNSVPVAYIGESEDGMIDAEETKRLKAKNLRFKKPICRDLNLEAIKNDLYDIMCECEDIRWYTDSEDGEDTLINALAGDEDEAYMGIQDDICGFMC